MRRRSVMVGVVALALVGAAAVAWRVSDGGSPDAEPATATSVVATEVVPASIVALARPVADPTEVPLPEPSAAVADWMDGEGAPVERFQAAARAVLEDADGACDALTARFAGVDAPDELAAIAQGAPTAETSDLVVSAVSAAARLLAACDGGPQAREAPTAELAYQWAILELHLAGSEAVR